MRKLVLIRHGQSLWNKENKFTGWTDVPLSELGIQEAVNAGKLLKEKGFSFHMAYTSYLKRAIDTLTYVLKEMGEENIPVEKSWKLNERHYGALQGLNKKETADEYGDEQVLIWRRSFDTKPPLLKADDERAPKFEKKYKDIPENELPLGESLKDTIERFIPYYLNEIAPKIKEGKNILIAAHGNTLRALVKYIENISNEDIIELNIPTGVPLIYELDDSLNFVKKYYLEK